ncbi:MAG: GDP-mannose 4,6-dehydratase [Acidobacteriota bacterium]
MAKKALRSLITGIGGFAGGHLAAALLARGEAVAGYTLGNSQHSQLEPILEHLQLVEADVLNGQALSAAMVDFRPDIVYHLAALTHVGEAWKKRRQTLEVNILGTATVLEAASKLNPKPKVLLASSGQVYGAGGEGGSILSERHTPRPLSPYAASKRCAETLALQAWVGESLATVIVRTFNFTGPWQTPDFVCSDFARQIAWAEAGLGPAQIRIGNLDARRDFSDVRDIVEGYMLIADRGEAGKIYNLASGRAIRIGDLLEQLLELSRVPIDVQQDPGRLRPVEITSMAGDASRARDELGWRPRVSLQETLESVLDFWRQQALRQSNRR